jgi:hypothetical protein
MGWKRTVRAAAMIITFALLLVLQCSTVAKAQQTNDQALTAAVTQLYENLQKKEFGAVWSMLTSGASRGTTQARYVDRLKRSSQHFNLSRYRIIRIITLRGQGNYAEVTTELTFELPKGKHQSTHFTLWLRESGTWRLDDERALEPGEQLSELPAWKIRQATPEISLPVGSFENSLPLGEMETLHFADVPQDNPVFQIGSEAGIFRQNRVNLRIQQSSTVTPVALAKLFSTGINAAQLSYSRIRQPIPENIRLVSGLSGISTPIYTLSKSVNNLADLSGKTVALVGFSPVQVELMSKTLQAGLQPTPSNLKIVSIRAVAPAPRELTKAVASEQADAFLVHPAFRNFTKGSPYKNIGIVEMQSAGIFMPQRFLSGRRDLALRFMKAYFESIAYYRTHKDASMLAMTEIWPNADIRVIAALYEKHSAELPARTRDLYPKGEDIKLSYPTITYPYVAMLGRMSDPTLVRALEEKGSIPANFQ